jgi:16S rRNA (guanine527-N7)-methyltransferase
LTTLGEWCLPLVSPGGRVLAIKGSKAEEELGAAWPALRKCGVASGVVRECGVGVVEPPTRVVDLATAASS